MKLTKKSIETDIVGFQQRIADARLKLADLPTQTNWRERKKVEAARRCLTSDIDPGYRLIGYSREALREV